MILPSWPCWVSSRKRNSAWSRSNSAQIVSTYRVANVFDVQTRSAIAATGANLFEVGHDYVLVEATPDEARALGRLGFTLEIQDRPSWKIVRY